MSVRHTDSMKIQLKTAADILEHNGFSRAASVSIIGLLSESIYEGIELDALIVVPRRYAEYPNKKSARADLGRDVKIAAAVERRCVVVDLSQSPAVA